jgi:tripartite-type tricarboxylate transporter receptor subunit TctC
VSGGPKRYSMRTLSQLLLLAAICAAAPLHAQTYPTRPVRFIVPFPPGGGTDLVARLVGKKLGERWSQTVVVDNRGGGNGIIGTAVAARSPADGHTFVIINSSFVVLPLLHADLPYNGLTDFSPVIRPAESPNIVVVKPDLPVASIADLIKLAKAKPGQLNFAEGGFAGPSHLSAELFNYLNGVRMARVSYKGTGPAMADLLGGHVDMMFATITGVLAHVRSGKLRALAVTGLRRAPVAPELPTVAESGVPGYEFVSWYGVMLPKGTPAPIVKKLHDAIREVLDTEEVRKLLAREGAEVTANGPAEFTRYLQTETKRWTKVMADMNVKGQR